MRAMQPDDVVFLAKRLLLRGEQAQSSKRKKEAVEQARNAKKEGKK